MQTTKTVQDRSHWSKKASDGQENGIEDLNISKIVQGRSDWTKRVQDGEEKKGMTETPQTVKKRVCIFKNCQDHLM
jgi:hypothetical protein